MQPTKILSYDAEVDIATICLEPTQMIEALCTADKPSGVAA